MYVKLGNYNLRDWLDEYDHIYSKRKGNKIIPGIRVCPSSNRHWIGVVVKSQEADNGYVNSVDVYWQTGPNAGKKNERLTSALINYDAYKEDIYKEVKELEDNEAKARTTGL